MTQPEENAPEGELPPEEPDEPSAPDSEKRAIEEDPLLPLGNPVRLVRGGVPLVIGSLIAFLIMAQKAQLRWGVPLGALAIVFATFGALDLLGTFDDPDETVAKRVSLRQLAAPLGMLAAGAGALFVLLTLAVAGRIGVTACAAAIPAAFLTLVVGVYRVGDALDAWEPGPNGEKIPLLRRHGFWLVVITTLLFLPMLGSHSLSDPWETHYGEVSREILARNDWISLWWAQDGWFWSKPILDFWLQALAMASLGVRYLPGEMLSAVSEGHMPFPEWAVRLPVFLLSLLAGYLLFKAISRSFGRRAGLLGGLVLATMPQWFLLSHQTMTDMPFVATMASAMALFLLGIEADPDLELKTREITLGPLRLRVSGFHLVFGAIVVCALPQLLYLFSRNLEITTGPLRIRTMTDAFMSGSAGNCGLPGNEICRAQGPLSKGLAPALQALIWVQTLAVLLYINWGERRVQRMYFLAAWFFAALSTMGKGPAGIGLPVLAAIAYLVATKRYRDLLRIEIAGGLLVFLAVAMPWFVAMYARHGQPFTDRLLFHDMFKRAFTHVHDTNEGDDTSFRFYVWQLGYATFPWTGLLPASLLWWLRRDDRAADARHRASVFLVMWFVIAFALFSLMLTKFHHYILPAVPPAAMLTGVFLDRAFPKATARAEGSSAWRNALYFAGILVGTLTSLFGLSLTIGALSGDESNSARVALGCALAALGVGVAYVAASRAGEPEAAAPHNTSAIAQFRKRHESTIFAAAALAGAGLVAAVGWDLASAKDGRLSQIRLLHLMTYNYKRPWPDSLDFAPALWAFSAGAVLLTFLLFAESIRRHVATALVALSVLFAAWGIDVYLVQISPHFGQRETMVAYYEAAREEPGPIVAYQMNWKGENFYAGNRIPAFVSSGKKFTQWVDEEKKKGVKVFYFMTEHRRASTLSNELGTPRFFDKLTDETLNNKFLLIRARFE